ncbi:OmpA family protein [Fibrella forsythiae]|uniref:OmpA family protein n=1 Tax=Fibrella forsythiae TaxID=2817061 RepID=A0ABS3JN15_9BACT|nr:OmpA family protein [Fibrella forsythiae]MBO0951399.1 OmpA family protein [Fibrella forsythiae]
MAVNLLTYLSDQFTPSVIDQLGQRIGESPANTGTAIKAIIPIVLGGLAQRTHTLSDADEIVDFLRHTSYTKSGTPLDIAQVSDTAAETHEAVSSGSTFIERVLPTNVDKVARAIAQHSHINRTSALSLMDLVGAVLEGVLGRQSLENGMTGLNMSTLVGGQVADIRAGIPAGLAGLATSLGFDKLGGPDTGEGQQVTTFMSTPVNPDIPKSPLVERERENVNWLRWAMIAVGALILFLIIQKCSQPQTATDGVYTDTTARSEPDNREDTSATTRANVAESNGTPAGTLPGGPAGAAAAAAEEKRQMELPGGRRIRVIPNTFNANLAQFLAGKTRPLPRTFTFENLTFETNSTRITSESQPNVNDLIEIMNAYPTLQINIQGHTDNTGDAAANKKLSLDRANAIRSVLTSAGVAANRITTQGFGAEKPTASNDNTEGRQQNRRIDVVLTKI